MGKAKPKRPTRQLPSHGDFQRSPVRAAEQRNSSASVLRTKMGKPVSRSLRVEPQPMIIEPSFKSAWDCVPLPTLSLFP